MRYGNWVSYFPAAAKSCSTPIFCGRCCFKSGRAGWRICGEKWATWNLLTRPWQSTSSYLPYDLLMKVDIASIQIVSKLVRRSWITW